MLNFREVTLADKPFIDRIYRSADLNNSHFCFSTLYLWCHSYQLYIAEIGDTFATMSTLNDRITYSCPAYCDNFEYAINCIETDITERGAEKALYNIPAEYVPILKRLFPGKYTFVPDRDNFDYVYLAQRLSTLAGKKLHAKRNHIHRFEEQNDWSFEEINDNNIAECAEMAKKWIDLNTESRNMDFTREHDVITCMFRDYNSLSLDGAILRSSGNIIGFTVGEMLKKDTFLTHFEKAYSEIQGAYAMLNREFARHILQKYPDTVYINREEDMGIENLRKAKLSYYPDFLSEKYTAFWGD